MTLKNYFKKAQKEKWAIGQFNFSTLEQLRGIFEAGKNLKSPLILGTSEGESKYLGLKQIIALTEILKSEHNSPVFLNLDHGKNVDWVKSAIDYGYDEVHFDGSALPFEENIKLAKEIVKYGHKKGVLVEGELGVIKGESAMHKENISVGENDLTDPNQVKEFIEKTGIDSLAIAIGSIHGVQEKMESLDFERLEKIQKNAKSFLVLHGGSGIPDEEIKKAISLGVNKINFNTELRIAWKNSLAESLRSDEAKPYKILPQVQKAVQQKVEEKISLLDSKNKM